MVVGVTPAKIRTLSLSVRQQYIHETVSAQHNTVSNGEQESLPYSTRFASVSPPTYNAFEWNPAGCQYEWLVRPEGSPRQNMEAASSR